MSRRAALALSAGPALFLAAFFIWPVGSILTTAFESGSVSRALAGGTGSVIWFTVWQAAVSTLITLAAGLPIAFVISRFDFPGRALLRAATLIPFVLPTLVVGVAFLALLGPGGVVGVDLSGTATAIVIAHVFFNIAVVVRLVGALWSHLDPRLEDAARSLGASPWRAFRTVTLPLLRPAIAASASIVFLFCFTSFGTVLVLGGPRWATLEVEIYRRSLFDLPAAAVLALVQIVGVVTALLLYSRHQQRSHVAQHLAPAAATARRPRSRGERVFVAATGTWAALWIAIPPLVLVWRALTPAGTPGLGAFRALADSPVVDVGGATASSLEYAIAATLIAVAIGVPAALVVAWRRGGASRWFDTLLMLPIGTSAVTVGFGMVVALDWPVDLRGTFVLVPIAHALIAIPFVVRAVSPVVASVGDRLHDAAAALGASPGRVRRTIDVPIAARAALVGAGLAFVVSLGEFGATTFTARPGAPTLPLAIYRLLGRPGPVDASAAMALSVVLMVLTATVVLAFDRVRLPGRSLF